MKVICIDASPGRTSPYTPAPFKEGEIVTVDEIINNRSYGLVEYPELYWAINRFIPLSDIDETERIDEVMETVFVEKDTKILENECIK